MPTGTKIATIVLVVLLAAAGLYYAFVPPAPSGTTRSPAGTSGSSGLSSATDSPRPSTLPPAGAGASGSSTTGSSTTGSQTGTPNLDALMQRNQLAQQGGAGTTGGVDSTKPATGGTVGLSDAQDAPSTLPPSGAAPGGARPFSNGLALGATSSQDAGAPMTPKSASSPTQVAAGEQTGAAPAAPAAKPATTAPTTAPTTTPTTTASTATTPSTYIVKAGDTFESIAKAIYGSGSQWKRISQANPTIEPKMMKVGTKLVIPPATAVASTGTSSGSSTGGTKPTTTGGTTSPAVSPSTGGIHVVAKNETLSAIAKKYYGNSKYWKTIKEANPGIDADRLAIGTKLKIPARSVVVSGENVGG